MASKCWIAFPVMICRYYRTFLSNCFWPFFVDWQRWNVESITCFDLWFLSYFCGRLVFDHLIVDPFLPTHKVTSINSRRKHPYLLLRSKGLNRSHAWESWTLARATFLDFWVKVDFTTNKVFFCRKFR